MIVIDVRYQRTIASIVVVGDVEVFVLNNVVVYPYFDVVT